MTDLMINLLSYVDLTSKIILLIISGLLFFVCLYYLLSSFKSMILTWWVPYISTFDKDLYVIKKNLQLHDGKTIVDLWCWDGKVLRFIAQKFKLKQIDWFDLNWFAIHYWKFLNKILWIKNINLARKDFKKIDISDYDYIYVYLMPECLAKIEDWIFKNMWKNTIIISNTFTFEKHEPYDTIRNKKGNPRIHFYKK